jgi:mannose PTS system EIIC component
MEISIFQAVLIGILSYAGSLSAVPLMGLMGGWYVLSRPIVSGLLIGLILGDVTTGVLVGVAVQVVFIALVTPGGAMPQDLNSAAYIGVTLGILAVKGGATVESSVAIATAVGVIGTIFHNFMMLSNSFWNHRAIKAIEKADYKGIMFNHFVGPQIVQMAYRVIPTAAILFFGAGLANNIIAMFPMDSFLMRTLTALGSMLPAVGVAILLRQVTKKNLELIYFLFGFTLIACLGINMIALAIIGAFFALLHFNYTASKSVVATANGAELEDDEEDDL